MHAQVIAPKRGATLEAPVAVGGCLQLASGDYLLLADGASRLLFSGVRPVAALLLRTRSARPLTAPQRDLSLTILG
jgi:hypothetical protein